MTLTRSGQCNSRDDTLDFGKGHEAPAPLWLSPAPGHSFSRCLFAEAVHRAAWISACAGKEACRQFSHVLEDLLRQGCAVGGSPPGGIESRILSYSLHKTWAPLGRKLTADSSQGCVVTGQVLVRNIGMEERSVVQIRHGSFVLVGDIADL